MVALASPQLNTSKSNEWYTPAKYIEAARTMMGGIDLDPASCELANQTIKAGRYYTKEDNGLAQEWYGKVWLNPPYGKSIPHTIKGRFSGGGNTKNNSLQSMFIHKAIQEYECGHITQAMLLVTANTTVAWFRPLWNYPMCTPYPKIRFYVLGSQEKQAQVFGNVFVYLGPYEQRFIEIFSQFGPIAKRVSIPKHSSPLTTLWENQS